MSNLALQTQVLELHLSGASIGGIAGLLNINRSLVKKTLEKAKWNKSKIRRLISNQVMACESEDEVLNIPINNLSLVPISNWILQTGPDRCPKLFKRMVDWNIAHNIESRDNTKDWNIETIQSLLDKGYPKSYIAQMTGISINTLRKHIGLNKLSDAKWKDNQMKFVNHRIYALIKDGRTIAQGTINNLAELRGVKPDTIRNTKNNVAPWSMHLKYIRTDRELVRVKKEKHELEEQ